MNRFAESMGHPADESLDQRLERARQLLQGMQEKLEGSAADERELTLDHPYRVVLEVFAEALAELEAEADSIEESLYPRLLYALGEEERWPAAAEGIVRFVVEPEEDLPVSVPAGTVVSAVRQAGEPRVGFETLNDITCSSARLMRVVGSTGDQHREWSAYPASDWSGEARPLFDRRLRSRRFLYLGDAALATLRSGLVELVLQWDASAAALIDADWEYSAGDGWRKGMPEWEAPPGSPDGSTLLMRLGGPCPDLAEMTVDGERGCWLRCSLASAPRDLRLSLPHWATVVSERPDVDVGFAGRESDEGARSSQVLLRFPRPVTRVLTHHEEAWRDHSFAPGVGVGSSASLKLAVDSDDWSPAVYFGWDRATAGSVLMKLAHDEAQLPDRERCARPEFVWEFSTSRGFEKIDVVDSTHGFTRSGTFSWEAPAHWSSEELHGERLFWLRACWVSGEYVRSPDLAAVVPHAVFARQARREANFAEEVVFDRRGCGRLSLSVPDGEPQGLTTIEIKTETDEWQTLQRASSPERNREVGGGASDAPLTSPESGAFQVRRWVDGSLLLDVGPTWSGTRMVRFPRLTFCLGEQGNLPSGSIQVVESEIPGVSGVEQPLATSGGRASESAGAFRQRLMTEWRASRALVTAADIERLCYALEPWIERIEIAVDRDRPSRIVVTVVPNYPCRAGRFAPPRLRWLQEELNERAVLGSFIEVVEAAYVDVDIIARPRHTVRGAAPASPVPAQRQAIARSIEAYFDPLHGGPECKGIPIDAWRDDEEFVESGLALVASPDWKVRYAALRKSTSTESSHWSGELSVRTAMDTSDLHAWRFKLRPCSPIPGVGWSLQLGASHRAAGLVVFPVLRNLVFEGDRPSDA